MTSTRYLLALLNATCWMVWTGTAAAAGLALNERAGVALSPLLKDPLVLAIALAIALAAGFTTLAIRLNMLFSQEPARPLVKPWLFAVAHVGGSFLAAGAALLVASMRQMAADEALLVVLVFAFIGSKVLETLAERYLAVVRVVAPPAAGA